MNNINNVLTSLVELSSDANIELDITNKKQLVEWVDAYDAWIEDASSIALKAFLQEEKDLLSTYIESLED